MIALNKPYLVHCKFTDDQDPPRPTLAQFGLPPRVYVAGRLDHDSEGLLLLTDDGKLNQRLGRRGRSLELNEAARALLCSGHDPRFGARDLIRRLRRGLEPVLAERLLEQPTATRLRASVDDAGLRVDVVS